MEDRTFLQILRLLSQAYAELPILTIYFFADYKLTSGFSPSASKIIMKIPPSELPFEGTSDCLKYL